MAQPPLIYQQIEQDSDYYEPSIYQSLLSFHHSLALGQDALADEFIPVTGAKGTPDKNRKLFVIGIIPPSSQVSGKLLDRSYTIGDPNGNSSIATFGPNGLPPTPPKTSPFTSGDGGGDGQNSMSGAGNTLSPEGAAFIRRAEGGGTFSPDPYPDSKGLSIGYGHLIKEGESFNPPITQQQAEALFQQDAQKFVNIVNSQVTVPVDQNQFDALVSLAYNLGSVPDDVRNAINKGDYKGAAQAFLEYNKYIPTGETQKVVNQGLAARRHEEMAIFNTNPNPSFTPPTPNWVLTGSTASQKANAQLNVSATNNDIGNGVNTGLKFNSQQQSMIAQTKLALNNMANTPPLKMLVNPSSFKLGNEKIISDGGWTRYGPADIVEHWGEQLDTIDCSGKIAAFQAVDLVKFDGSPGITRIARQYSASYQNFLSLYMLYRNNAGLYLVDNVEPTDTKKQVMSVLGSIYIYFDHYIYIGSFDNFTITETDTSPHSLEYSFKFTVRASFGLDQVVDPNYTYGIPQGGFSIASPTIPTTQAATVGNGALPSDAQVAADTAYTAAIGAGATSGQAQAASVDAAATAATNGGADFQTASSIGLLAAINGSG